MCTEKYVSTNYINKKKPTPITKSKQENHFMILCSSFDISVHKISHRILVHIQLTVKNSQKAIDLQNKNKKKDKKLKEYLFFLFKLNRSLINFIFFIFKT